MSTNPKEIQKMEKAMTTKAPSFKQVDAQIRALDVKTMEQENALLPQTLTGRLERVLKIYAGIKPLLALIVTLPLIPATWRAAVALFNQAIDAVAIGAGEIDPDFKAGKDL
jgi:hypothetical protein